MSEMKKVIEIIESELRGGDKLPLFQLRRLIELRELALEIQETVVALKSVNNVENFELNEGA